MWKRCGVASEVYRKDARQSQCLLRYHKKLELVRHPSYSRYNPIQSMKAYVTVMLKTTVLDPQGKTIHGALKKMGYKGVAGVRQGKLFELQLDGTLEKDAAKAEIERIAREVLTNPVIEEFSYRLED